MRKRMKAILLTGLIMAALTGCGGKTGTVKGFFESGAAVGAEGTDAFTGAEDDNIVLYAEEGEQKYCPLSDSAYYEDVKTFMSEKEEIPLYNGDGNRVGHIKIGKSIVATENAENIFWSRFENPISGTEYDYLYVLNDYMIDPDKVYLDAAGMKRGIEDFIVKWFPADVDDTPVFLTEKASDMELYECRMNSVYSDEGEYEYWLLEQFVRKNELFTTDYETFYIECEEDADDWIDCRVYYKDATPKAVASVRSSATGTDSASSAAEKAPDTPVGKPVTAPVEASTAAPAEVPATDSAAAPATDSAVASAAVPAEIPEEILAQIFAELPEGASVEIILEEPEPKGDRYTPEEAIAIYRSLMEAGGMTWDPSLKGNWDETIGLYPIEDWYHHMENYNGSSWGTGFIFLDKGMPEWAAGTDLESCAIGDSVGHPWTSYYLEVTGYDAECVYITAWH